MRVHKAAAVLVGLLLWGGGCDDIECGAGTVKRGGVCVVETADASVLDGAVDAGPVSCGDGTKLEDGKCVPKPMKPIGAGCALGTECASGTCAPAAENLPGGMCTVIGCSMDTPCPSGSTCYKLSSGISLCFPYCDRGTACRTDENYHCQPLYTSALNICAPSCELSKSCTAGTRCNTESGLCELAECEVAAATTGCTEEEICYKDSKGLSTKGGLCLHMCETAHPEKTCVLGKDEVCQPLATDLSKGFCAPPVCTKNSDCPAGAECSSRVCLPPASCDAEHACPDERTCVSGKCLPKCPTGDTHCSDIHPGLVCADVLATPACLPLGSFPGSDCRATTENRCDSVKAGSSTVPMVCENNKCLAECTTGGDTVCSALSSTLQCAHGIFSKDLCLPKGSYPGSACGANNTCAQNLSGEADVDMKCVAGTCVIGCSETGKWAGYGDALCSFVDSSLTCATKAGAICVRACGTGGSCDTGYSCLDPGTVPAHENACLPTGSFPGSPCRATAGNECDQNVGGNADVDMACVRGACVVKCPGADETVNDALCNGVSNLLTCAESAGHLCVYKCSSTGNCAALPGYSCLTSQDACLPTGSFPGSPCRATSGDECDQDVGGNAAVDMACTGGACVVKCPGADETVNDALCNGVSTLLTCAESAGHLCVLKCGAAGACSITGYSCLDAGAAPHQNACLPDGTFPFSKCRTTGVACDQDLFSNPNLDMECLGDTCLVKCPADTEALCTPFGLTCYSGAPAPNHCFPACTGPGTCPATASMCDVTEMACHP